MAWFDDLSLPGFTVEGRFGWVTADGSDDDSAPELLLARGEVVFTPTAPAVRVNGAWIGIRPVTAVIYNGGIVLDDSEHPVRLLSTDADTGVDGWGWVAKVNVEGAKIPDVRFLGPTGTTVNLTGDNLAPITGSPVEVIAGSQGEKGDKGDRGDRGPAGPSITRTAPGVFTIEEVVA